MIVESGSTFHWCVDLLLGVVIVVSGSTFDWGVVIVSVGGPFTDCCDSECGSTFHWGVVIVSVSRPFTGVL